MLEYCAFPAPRAACQFGASSWTFGGESCFFETVPVYASFLKFSCYSNTKLTRTSSLFYLRTSETLSTREDPPPIKYSSSVHSVVFSTSLSTPLQSLLHFALVFCLGLLEHYCVVVDE